ncbi:hypothetical protein BDZ91DRAFT_852890 [Kalaharituber pfeilii]|nr:hypothetical protein BDZ91DRAFT_852890 [Kalaharituber pfeilii]
MATAALPVANPVTIDSPLSSNPSDITDYVQLITQADDKIGRYQQDSVSADKTGIILQSFLKCLPTAGRINVANDIVECCDDSQLRQLAQHLLTAILFPMKALRKTPVSSPRFAAESDVEEVSSGIESATRSRQAQLKASCLLRDGNRCLITGYYDHHQSRNSQDGRHHERMTDLTEVAHIIPFALGSFPESELHAAAIIWDGLYRCFPNLRQNLTFSSGDINETYNAMTLCSTLHTLFGDFGFTLFSTDIENTYKIKTYPGFPSTWVERLPKSMEVQFTAHDGRYLLPSPLLLGVHAAVAQILHMSGMAEQIDKVMRDRDHIGCLAPNGSTDIQHLMLVW